MCAGLVPFQWWEWSRSWPESGGGNHVQQSGATRCDKEVRLHTECLMLTDTGPLSVCKYREDRAWEISSHAVMSGEKVERGRVVPDCM